eukprot:gnl/Spiro4/2411_TR1156_c1_g1_i1.p1 gnl/Spiro4/2411_TR1156_c1_g1~~gnl/Spiro4/2411_TR1156_c1_g1_i1.p1  ORF type:complete len:266 (-),score=50.20 gnl/Spiro4/2411_TR1156_c1_g1_i1:35-832(-)
MRDAQRAAAVLAIASSFFFLICLFPRAVSAYSCREHMKTYGRYISWSVMTSGGSSAVAECVACTWRTHPKYHCRYVVDSNNNLSCQRDYSGAPPSRFFKMRSKQRKQHSDEYQVVASTAHGCATSADLLPQQRTLMDRAVFDVYKDEVLAHGAYSEYLMTVLERGLGKENVLPQPMDALVQSPRRSNVVTLWRDGTCVCPLWVLQNRCRFEKSPVKGVPGVWMCVDEVCKRFCEYTRKPLWPTYDQYDSSEDLDSSDSVLLDELN